jgi:hypothetical protein
MARAHAGVSCLALLVAALAVCACFVSARSERLDAGAGAMDAAALKSCLGSVHSRDAEEKLLTLGSAWNSMSPPSRLAFLQEIRRAERAEEVDDFTLLQIAAVESPEFSRAPVGCFSTALQVRACGRVLRESVCVSFRCMCMLRACNIARLVLLRLGDASFSASRVYVCSCVSRVGGPSGGRSQAHPERVWDSFSTDERKMILLELEDVFNSISKVATSAKMQPPAAKP